MKQWVLAVFGVLALICICQAVPLAPIDQEDGLKFREVRNSEPETKDLESEEEKKEEKEDEKEETEEKNDEKDDDKDDERNEKEVKETQADEEDKVEGNGKGKIDGVIIEDKQEKDEKEEKDDDSDEQQPAEDESKDDDEEAAKKDKTEKPTSVQAKRCGFGGCGGFGYGWDGCGGFGDGWGGCGIGGGCGHGGCEWGLPGEGCCCSNCCGGFGHPHSCGGCGCGCCPNLNFPCTFGACVNNPCCECCQKKPPKGKCQWPCYWPCCCTCTPPEFKFKPLKAKPLCHCPHGHGCGDGHRRQGPLKRTVVPSKRDGFFVGGYGHGCDCGGNWGCSGFPGFYGYGGFPLFGGGFGGYPGFGFHGGFPYYF